MMHIEILIEDSSGATFLQAMIPKLLGGVKEPHTWRIHAYKGVGRLPGGLKAGGDPTKRILLDQLPRLLRGYGRTPGIDAVVVVVDSDQRDCGEFLRELKEVARQCGVAPPTMFRIAIEELEAWYLGDRIALGEAYPRLKQVVLDRYVQDSICGTWELLADAVYPGGAAAIRKAGWPSSGQIKHEWAQKIGPLLDPDRNTSVSFGKFRDGLRRLAAQETKLIEV